MHTCLRWKAHSLLPRGVSDVVRYSYNTDYNYSVPLHQSSSRDRRVEKNVFYAMVVPQHDCLKLMQIVWVDLHTDNAGGIRGDSFNGHSILSSTVQFILGHVVVLVYSYPLYHTCLPLQ